VQYAAHTLVEEGDAIICEEGLELHGLRSAAAAAAAASAFVFPSCGEGVAVLRLPLGDLARIWKGFAPKSVVTGWFGFLLRHTWAFFWFCAVGFIKFMNCDYGLDQIYYL